MPGKRALNGIGPNTRPKAINSVPLTKQEWAKLEACKDKLDATSGYIAAQAIRQWMARR